MTGIKVISQTTAEREQETKELFEQIRPYLDKGMSYSNAVKKIRNETSRRNYYTCAWYRELCDYGSRNGYPYEDYKYSRVKG